MKKIVLFVCISFVWIALQACQEKEKKVTEKKDSLKNLPKQDTLQIVLDEPSDTLSSFVDNSSFSIQFPDSPERTENPEKKSVEYLLSLNDDTTRYVLYYQDYKEGEIEKYGVKSFLENQKKQIVQSYQFAEKDIIENKEITLDNHIGFSLRAGAKENFFLVYRIYAVKNRVYQISISDLKKYPEEKAIQSFFESFKIKNKLTGSISKS
ncbi:MAG: hypothetical protein SFU27_05280 [Thermonemataceae bacterium]|nr:hypothetical protein [Thermonemataceae bacterium]